MALAITAPTLIIEENWHGRPMIDRPGDLWLVPTLVVAVGFALGGAVRARRTNELWRAMVQGLVLGVVVTGVLLGADAVRRALHHQALSSGVVRLWVEAALLSIVLTSLGGAAGYLYATRHD